MTATELNKIVTSFESTAFDIAHDHGGRVVKHIGDEVMFVALDVPTGVRIARALIASFTEQGIRPAVASPMASYWRCTVTTTGRS